MSKQDNNESACNEKLKNIVFKYANQSQDTISATALVNILSKLHKGEVCSKASEQLEKLDKIEKNLEAVRARGTENQEKIEALQNTLETIRDSIKKSNEALHTRMDDMIEHYDYRMEKLEKLATLSILQNNGRERRDRCFSIKVHQYADYSRQDQGPIQIKHIFERILKPCLMDAHRKGEIDEVPEFWYNCVEYGHQLGSNREGPSAPQNYIIRLRSRYYLNAILRNKCKYLEELNNQNKSLNKSYADAVQQGKFFPCRIGNDTTQLDRDVLSWLCTHPEVNRAYVRGQKLVFSLKIRPQFFFQVLNPFGRTLKELTTPVMDEKYWLKTINRQSPFLQPAFIKGKENKGNKLDMTNHNKINPLLADDDKDVDANPDKEGTSEPANKRKRDILTPLMLVQRSRNRSKYGSIDSPANKQLKFSETPTQNRFQLLESDVDDDIQRPPLPEKVRRNLNSARSSIINDLEKGKADDAIDALDAVVGNLLDPAEGSSRNVSRDTSKDNSRNVSREVSSEEDTTGSQTQQPMNQRKSRRNKKLSKAPSTASTTAGTTA